MGDGGGGGGGDFGGRKFSGVSSISGHNAFLDTSGKIPLLKRSTRREKRLMIVIAALIIIVIILIVLVSVYASRYSKIKNKPEVCFTEACVISAASIAEGLDRTVDPCDDFYAFACGRWASAHPLPDFGLSLDWYSLAQKTKMRGVTANLRKPSNDEDPDILDRVRKLYATCEDLALADAGSVKPLWALLEGLQLETPPADDGNGTERASNWTLTEVLSAAHVRGLPLLMTVDVGVDAAADGAKRYALAVAPPKDKGFLPGYPMYEERVGRRDAPRRMAAEVQRLAARAAAAAGSPPPDEAGAAGEYVRYAATVIAFMRDLQTLKEDPTALNTPSPPHRFYSTAGGLLAFDAGLTEISKNATEQESTTVTIDELQDMWDNLTENMSDPRLTIHWSKFLSTLLESANVEIKELGDQTVLLYPGSFLEALVELLDTSGADAVGDYMWWAVVRSLGPYTSQTLRKFKEKHMDNIYKEFSPPGRSTFCANSMYKLLPDVASYSVLTPQEMYKATESVREMLDDISWAFERSLRHQRWLDAETRAAALKKVRAVRVLAGGPSRMRDWYTMDQFYENLTLQHDTFLENLMQTLQFRTYMRISELGLKYKPRDWDEDTGPLDVNAFYVLQENIILIPYGMIEYPFSQLGLEALDYAFLGCTLGHELSHGFDNDGRLYDESGSERNWWSNSSASEYEERAECFVRQYGNYTVPISGKHLDGRLTLGENIADNGGLTAALGALRRAQQRRGEKARRRALPGFEGFSEEQLFFLAYAASWCEHIGPEVDEDYVIQDTHSPGPLRALGTLKNSKAFADAWGCKAGSPMAPADEDRCTIW